MTTQQQQLLKDLNTQHADLLLLAAKAREAFNYNSPSDDYLTTRAVLDATSNMRSALEDIYSSVMVANHLK